MTVEALGWALLFYAALGALALGAIVFLMAVVLVVGAGITFYKNWD